MPQVFAGRHHQARRLVVVKRAATNPVLAVLLLFDARGFHQPLDGHLRLQAGQFVIGYTGHRDFPKILSRLFRCFILAPYTVPLSTASET